MGNIIDSIFGGKPTETPKPTIKLAVLPPEEIKRQEKEQAEEDAKDAKESEDNEKKDKEEDDEKDDDGKKDDDEDEDEDDDDENIPDLADVIKEEFKSFLVDFSREKEYKYVVTYNSSTDEFWFWQDRENFKLFVLNNGKAPIYMPVGNKCENCPVSTFLHNEKMSLWGFCKGVNKAGVWTYEPSNGGVLTFENGKHIGITCFNLSQRQKCKDVFGTTLSNRILMRS